MKGSKSEETKKSRILNMIGEQAFSHFPSDIWLSDVLYERLKQELHTNDEGLRECLDNHLIIVSTLDNHTSWEDPVLLERGIQKGYVTLNKEENIVTDCWGVEWDIAHEGIYEHSNPLSYKDDLGNITLPDTSDDELFKPIVDTVEQLGDRYCIVGTQDLTIFERACALRGFENFLVDIKLHTQFAHTLLDFITDYQSEIAKRIASTGVDIAFTGGDYGTQEDLIISYEDWREFILPRISQIWDVYKKEGLPILHHSCGNIIKLIPDIIDAGVDILNPIQHVMQPEVLAERFGDDIIFFGGIDSQHVIPFGKPEDIKEEVKRIIQIFQNTKGYIIAPDQCLMSNVPTENIMALTEAIKTYAKR